jgi:hypothetical protein
MAKLIMLILARSIVSVRSHRCEICSTLRMLDLRSALEISLTLSLMIVSKSKSKSKSTESGGSSLCSFCLSTLDLHYCHSQKRPGRRDGTGRAGPGRGLGWDGLGGYGRAGPGRAWVFPGLGQALSSVGCHRGLSSSLHVGLRYLVG